jgi:hypothetical protein
MFKLWRLNKGRLGRAFRRRGWKVEYCKNGALVVTTPNDIYFFGPDATPDNFLGFAWNSLRDSRTWYSYQNTLRKFLVEFGELDK